MDPMSQIIEGLPGGSQQPIVPMLPAQQQPMFQNVQPQQPQAPQAQAPIQPQWQQPVPQPPAPGQQPQMPQQGFTQPIIPGAPQQQGYMPAMPIIPQVPQFPSEQQNQSQQMPAWAQQLMQSIQQDNGGQQEESHFDPTQPWTSENRPKSWSEMQKAQQAMAAQQAQAIVTQTLQQQQQAAQQAQQQQAEANQRIDMTFNRLRLSGALPPIQNPNDPNDPGKQAEQELLGFTLAMGGQTAEDMLYAAPTLLQRHQTGQYFDPKTNQMTQRRGQSAAAMAPIAGGMPVMGMMGAPEGPTQSQLAAGSKPGNLSQLYELGMSQVQ